MGEVARESSSELEWDLVQRVLVRLWNSASLTAASFRFVEEQEQIS
jgi:hypothetical protein